MRPFSRLASGHKCTARTRAGMHFATQRRTPFHQADLPMHRPAAGAAHQHQLRHQVGVGVVGIQCCRVLRHAVVKQLLVPLVPIKACGWGGWAGGVRRGWLLAVGIAQTHWSKHDVAALAQLRFEAHVTHLARRRAAGAT